MHENNPPQVHPDIGNRLSRNKKVTPHKVGTHTFHYYFLFLLQIINVQKFNNGAERFATEDV